MSEAQPAPQRDLPPWQPVRTQDHLTRVQATSLALLQLSDGWATERNPRNPDLSRHLSFDSSSSDPPPTWEATSPNSQLPVQPGQHFGVVARPLQHEGLIGGGSRRRISACVHPPAAETGSYRCSQACESTFLCSRTFPAALMAATGVTTPSSRYRDAVAFLTARKPRCFGYLICNQDVKQPLDEKSHFLVNAKLIQDYVVAHTDIFPGLDVSASAAPLTVVQRLEVATIMVAELLDARHRDREAEEARLAAELRAQEDAETEQGREEEEEGEEAEQDNAEEEEEEPSMPDVIIYFHDICSSLEHLAAASAMPVCLLDTVVLVNNPLEEKPAEPAAPPPAAKGTKPPAKSKEPAAPPPPVIEKLPPVGLLLQQGLPNLPNNLRRFHLLECEGKDVPSGQALSLLNAAALDKDEFRIRMSQVAVYRIPPLLEPQKLEKLIAQYCLAGSSAASAPNENIDPSTAATATHIFRAGDKLGLLAGVAAVIEDIVSTVAPQRDASAQDREKADDQPAAKESPAAHVLHELFAANLRQLREKDPAAASRRIAPLPSQGSRQTIVFNGDGEDMAEQEQWGLLQGTPEISAPANGTSLTTIPALDSVMPLRAEERGTSLTELRSILSSSSDGAYLPYEDLRRHLCMGVLQQRGVFAPQPIDLSGRVLSEEQDSLVFRKHITLARALAGVEPLFVKYIDVLDEMCVALYSQVPSSRIRRTEYIVKTSLEPAFGQWMRTGKRLEGVSDDEDQAAGDGDGDGEEELPPDSFDAQCRERKVVVAGPSATKMYVHLPTDSVPPVYSLHETLMFSADGLTVRSTCPTVSGTVTGRRSLTVSRHDQSLFLSVSGASSNTGAGASIVLAEPKARRTVSVSSTVRAEDRRGEAVVDVVVGARTQIRLHPDPAALRVDFLDASDSAGAGSGPRRQDPTRSMSAPGASSWRSVHVDAATGQLCMVHHQREPSATQIFKMFSDGSVQVGDKFTDASGVLSGTSHRLLSATSYDEQTGATIVAREDLLTRVSFPNGTQLLQHADGTRFWEFSPAAQRGSGDETQTVILIETPLPVEGQPAVPPVAVTVDRRHGRQHAPSEGLEAAGDKTASPEDRPPTKIVSIRVSDACMTLRQQEQAPGSGVVHVVDLSVGSLLSLSSDAEHLQTFGGKIAVNRRTGSLKSVDADGNLFLASAQTGECVVVLADDPRRPSPELEQRLMEGVDLSAEAARTGGVDGADAQQEQGQAAANEDENENENEDENENENETEAPPPFVPQKPSASHEPRIFLLRRDGTATEYLRYEILQEAMSAGTDAGEGEILQEAVAEECGPSSVCYSIATRGCVDPVQELLRQPAGLPQTADIRLPFSLIPWRTEQRQHAGRGDSAAGRKLPQVNIRQLVLFGSPVAVDRTVMALDAWRTFQTQRLVHEESLRNTLAERDSYSEPVDPSILQSSDAVFTERLRKTLAVGYSKHASLLRQSGAGPGAVAIAAVSASAALQEFPPGPDGEDIGFLSSADELHVQQAGHGHHEREAFSQQEASHRRMLDDLQAQSYWETADGQGVRQQLDAEGTVDKMTGRRLRVASEEASVEYEDADGDGVMIAVREDEGELDGDDDDEEGTAGEAGATRRGAGNMVPTSLQDSQGQQEEQQEGQDAQDAMHGDFDVVSRRRRSSFLDDPVAADATTTTAAAAGDAGGSGSRRHRDPTKPLSSHKVPALKKALAAAEPHSKRDETLRSISTSSTALGGAAGDRGLCRIVARPPELRFGRLVEGHVYRMSFQLSNVGDHVGRFRIARPRDQDCVQLHYKPGPIAAGMSIVVDVDVVAGRLGAVDEIVKIVSETHVISVPVSAMIEGASERDADRLDIKASVRVLS